MIVLQQSWMKLERNGPKVALLFNSHNLICELNNFTLHHLFGALEKEEYIKGRKIFSEKTTTAFEKFFLW